MHYFLLVLRRLRKNPTFTLLNIVGLSLGLTTFLLIALYVTDELSFDRFNTKADRLVRINTDTRINGESTSFAIAAPPVAATLKNNYPEVEATVRILRIDQERFRKDAEDIREKSVAFADSNLFEIFTLPFIEGNPHTALKNERSIVLTESTAKRYFNTTHAIGRTIYRLEDSSTYTVTAVIRDIPAQSHFHFDFFLPLQFHPIAQNHNYYTLQPIATFALLKPGADLKSLNKKLDAFMRTWDKDYAAYEKTDFYVHLDAIPLTDIHLHSNRTDELGTNSSIQYVYIFSVIAILVLLIACINYMNLSTAHSANRAREVGVRKVLGSPRLRLALQFLGESMIITALAVILAIAATALLLPLFNQLTGKELSIKTWLGPITAGAAVLTILVGLLSGLYPAFYLSGFRPINVLKGQLALGLRNGRLRNALVVFQFTISVFLIVGVIVVSSQLSYLQKKDVGFNRSQILIVKGLNALDQPTTLKDQVRKLPGVDDATISAFLPTADRRWHNWGKSQTQKEFLQTELWEVDEDYIPTMQMKLTQGRNFSKELPTDSTSIIINETAARMYGLLPDPLNKTIEYPHFWRPTTFKVIGVIRDFNFNSMRSNVTPLVMVLWPDYDPSLSIRIKPGNIATVLEQTKAAWTTLAPHRKFEYSFMDNDFDALYLSEQRLGRIVILLATLAIFIACLGLFGLAAYAAEQRSKEISIRKVLGAGAPVIFMLMSRDFGKPILLSILIATPIAWLALHQWLQGFAYRTTISPLAFVLAGLIVISIAFLTTFYQSFKAAVINPVVALRSE